MAVFCGNGINYSLYSGAGNLFALIDNRTRSLLVTPEWIRALSQESSPPVDGVILIEPSLIGDVLMRIFNRDGSEASMCGNGVRCCIQFLHTLGDSRPRYRIETGASATMGLLIGSSLGDEVEVTMGQPHSMRWHCPLSLPGRALASIHALNTGVPHAVITINEVETLYQLPLESIGALIRHHPYFGPEGTNATFMALIDAHTLAIRVYERGVEGETAACGTGAVAAAVVGALAYGMTPPITVYFASQECLLINFTHREQETSVITVRGPAQKIGSGTFVSNFLLV